MRREEKERAQRMVILLEDACMFMEDCAKQAIAEQPTRSLGYAMRDYAHKLAGEASVMRQKVYGK